MNTNRSVTHLSKLSDPQRKEVVSSPTFHKPLPQTSRIYPKPDAIKQINTETTKPTIICSMLESDMVVSMDSLKTLTLKQLRRLGSELYLNLNTKVDKKTLLEDIICNLKKRKMLHIPFKPNNLSKSMYQKNPIHWSPPKTPRNKRDIIITDKYPEKGVRIMKTSEAWSKNKTLEERGQIIDEPCLNSEPKFDGPSQLGNSFAMDIDSKPTEQLKSGSTDSCSRICELETEWSKREKGLKDMLKISDEKVCVLQEQLNAVKTGRNSLQSKLMPTPSAAKLALDSLINSPFARELIYMDAKVGLALKLDNLMETVADLRNLIDKLSPSHEKTSFNLVKGDGHCLDSSFPSKPMGISERVQKQLLSINKELGGQD